MPAGCGPDGRRGPELSRDSGVLLSRRDVGDHGARFDVAADGRRARRAVYYRARARRRRAGAGRAGTARGGGTPARAGAGRRGDTGVSGSRQLSQLDGRAGLGGGADRWPAGSLAAGSGAAVARCAGIDGAARDVARGGGIAGSRRLSAMVSGRTGGVPVRRRRTRGESRVRGDGFRDAATRQPGGGAARLRAGGGPGRGIGGALWGSGGAGLGEEWVASGGEGEMRSWPDEVAHALVRAVSRPVST